MKTVPKGERCVTRRDVRCYLLIGNKKADQAFRQLCRAYCPKVQGIIAELKEKEIA